MGMLLQDTYLADSHPSLIAVGFGIVTAFGGSIGWRLLGGFLGSTELEIGYKTAHKSRQGF